MRKSAFVLLALVLVGCAKGEPIVGKWRSDGMAGAVTMEFKKDGTAAMAMDFNKMIDAMKKQMPQMAAMPQAQIDMLKKRAEEQQKQQKITWAKGSKAGIYKVQMAMGGAAAQDVYFKVEESKLSTCSQDGGPAVGQANTFTRAE